MMGGELQARVEEARRRLDLMRIIEQEGAAPHDGKWSSFTCPFCEKKKRASLRKFNGRYWFKCWSSSCPSGSSSAKGSLDEPEYLARQMGVSRRDAFRAWMQQAGVWQDRDERVEPPQKTPSIPKSDFPAGPHNQPNHPLPQQGGGALPESVVAPPDVSSPVSGDDPPWGDGSGPGSPHLQAAPEPGPASPETNDGNAVGGGAAPPPVDPPGPPDKDDAAGDGEDWDEGLRALRWFYERCPAAPSQWAKRGLTAQTCADLRGNPKENEVLLLGMVKYFSMDGLLASGLWSRPDRGDAPAPNRQFYGYGVIGKRPKSEGQRESEMEWGWTHPVLIPYHSHDGELVALRPHKGMVKGGTPRLYVPSPESEGQRVFDTAVVTEGEFKAKALLQVLGSERSRMGRAQYGIAAVPGISLTKSEGGGWWIRMALDRWLRESGAERVVVAYDSEEKGDPNLPGYNPDKSKRYDSVVWAWYLAEELAKRGYDARVCVLPREWRNNKGKADWDGALAQLLEGAPESRWNEERPRLARVFSGVLKAAPKASALREMDLFSAEENKILFRNYKKISYEVKLPRAHGREGHEGWVARRLGQFLRACRRTRGRIPEPALQHLSWIHSQYQQMPEAYYIFKPPPTRNNPPPGGNYRENWVERMEAAMSSSDEDYAWACSLALKGAPEVISDFVVKPYYLAERETGELTRLIRVANVHGETTKVKELDPVSFSRPEALRVWLAKNANGAWCGGVKELNFLQLDLDAALAHRRVHEVPRFGWNAPSKMWFFDDVAIGADGLEVCPDEEGVFRIRDVGYRVSDRDQEGEEFKQGRPKLQPRVDARDLWTMEIDGREEKFDSEDDAVRNLFQECSARLVDTLGGGEGLLVLSMPMACAAGPELYEEHTAFPGLWLHGEQQQGKSSIARWLTRIWGFTKETGVALKNSSRVGILIALQQYSNLYVWLEEFQTDMPPEILETIKNAFNRESGVKKTFGEAQRRILASAIVTGVATSSDAQVRSRYPHVQVSAERRRAEHFRWFQDHSGKFFLLGRWLLRHRTAYVEKVKELMKGWMLDPRLAKVENRARYVYAVAFAGVAAGMALLKSHAASDTQKYRDWLITHCLSSTAQVSEVVDVNKWWADLLSLFQLGVFGHRREDWMRYFSVREVGCHPHPPGAPPHPEMDLCPHCQAPQWRSYKLFLAPGPILELMAKHMRSAGRSMSLSLADLRSQMSQRKYYIPPNKGAWHKQRFGPWDTSGTYCWAIDLDSHDLGLQHVSPAALEESRLKVNQTSSGPVTVYQSTDEWADPRQGPLFQLVHALIGPPPTLPGHSGD